MFGSENSAVWSDNAGKFLKVFLFDGRQVGVNYYLTDSALSYIPHLK